MITYGLVKQNSAYAKPYPASYKASNTEVIQPRTQFIHTMGNTVYNPSKWGKRQVMDIEGYANPKLRKLQASNEAKMMNLKTALAKVFGTNFSARTVRVPHTADPKKYEAGPPTTTATTSAETQTVGMPTADAQTDLPDLTATTPTDDSMTDQIIERMEEQLREKDAAERSLRETVLQLEQEIAENKKRANEAMNQVSQTDQEIRAIEEKGMMTDLQTREEGTSVDLQTREEGTDPLSPVSETSSMDIDDEPVFREYQSQTGEVLILTPQQAEQYRQLLAERVRLQQNYLNEYNRASGLYHQLQVVQHQLNLERQRSRTVARAPTLRTQALETVDLQPATRTDTGSDPLRPLIAEAGTDYENPETRVIRTLSTQTRRRHWDPDYQSAPRSIFSGPSTTPPNSPVGTASNPIVISPTTPTAPSPPTPPVPRARIRGGPVPLRIRTTDLPPSRQSPFDFTGAGRREDYSVPNESDRLPTPRTRAQLARLAEYEERNRGRQTQRSASTIRGSRTRSPRSNRSASVRRRSR